MIVFTIDLQAKFTKENILSQNIVPNAHSNLTYSNQESQRKRIFARI
jgi:hypothetical protein